MTERKTAAVGEQMLSGKHELLSRDGAENIPIDKSLLYLGQDGSCFKLGYRESSCGTARYPFSENFTYEKPLPDNATEIACKELRIRVFSVSNISIEFELLSGWT